MSGADPAAAWPYQDRKSTRLNSSHLVISYAVFCLKKKKTKLPFASSMQPRNSRHGVQSRGVIAINASASRALLPFAFFFNNTATTKIYTLSLHDALPI